MAYQEILYEVADRVAIVTLNRPEKLNALTPRMTQEVYEAMLGAEQDEEVRVIVFTGAGRGFCAGADMASLEQLAEGDVDGLDPDKLRGRMLPPRPRAGAAPDFQKTYSYFPAVEKPIIAAINGVAVGLGFVLPLYCDVRIAADTARFGTAFARRGLIAEHGISWLLPRLVGIANALDLLFSARLIDAMEAWRLGLVNRVVPQDQLRHVVLSYASELANGVSPRSLRLIKREVYGALFQTLGEAIDTANEDMIASFQSADFQEGVAHFLEKRPPRFTGR